MIQIGQELINPAHVSKVSYTPQHPRAAGGPSVLTVTIDGLERHYYGNDERAPGTNPPITNRQQVDAAWAQLKPKP